MKISLNELKNLVKQVLKEEDEENLRQQLHTLVGDAMRLGKRADMTGAPHHEAAYEEAERKLNSFLRNNPSMNEYLETVENHFIKKLYS